ncbi:hypothetical protein [Methylobacterium sp. WL19]|uniref:hypothetical protein n=1 Tax=Methylobacterium sp. WL19 TaxID=2603896 RepID=UPI0011CA0E7D|nr:hypothetical protein [Methylobacterium sp. WL19]TXN27397.1 hypothetical protein FV220_11585 [Methylobacterium sp. WL19]
MTMHIPMERGWKKRVADNAALKAARNDPELLARRQELQARQEAERQEQARLTAEADARRASEMVQFPAMSMAMAADLIDAFARYKGANRSSTPAEIESLSRTVHGLDPYPGQVPVHFFNGLPQPIPMGSVTDAPAVATMKPQAAPVADSVLKAPTKGRAKAVKATVDGFLIED